MKSLSFSRRRFICLSLVAPWAFSNVQAQGSAENLNDLLLPILKSSGLPAIAAATMKDGKLLGQGAVGVRKMGMQTQVRLEDKFHLGSNTKAMTATLLAMLVEEGKLRWNHTLGEIFPERVSRMHASYAKVTVNLLLSHRSGAPDNSHHYGSRDQPLPVQRLAHLDSVVTKTPYTIPGTRYLYSNAGYIIAGSILERITGESWEEFIEARLFRPLAMHTAGFGPAAKADLVDQPWGHIFRAGRFEPNNSDNPPALGPAGTVHCSMADYLKFADFHCSVGRRPDDLLKPASLLKLQVPEAGASYAMGWGVGVRDWARGRVLTHMGSNNRNYFVTWIAPEIGFSMAVASNAAGPNVAETIDRICRKLIEKFARA